MSSLPTGQSEPETQPEMIRMDSGTPADFVDAAAFAKSLIKGRSKRVYYKAKRVQEVALTGTIRTNQEGERTQFHVTCGQTLVAPSSCYA